MTSTEEIIEFSQDVWELFVREVQLLGDDLYHWVTTLSDQERMIGICVFILVLMYMIFSRRVKKDVDTGSGRQFSGALLLVIIFAFGAGWSMDTSAGSFSYIFSR